MINFRDLFLLFLFTLILFSCSENEPQESSAQQSGTPVAGYEVIQQDLSRTVSASGAVEALHIRIAGAPFAGIIESVDVEEGDEISRGDRLAAYDLTETEAELRRSEAQVHEVRQRVERIERLLDGDAISRSEYEDVQAELAVAEAEKEVWQTRAELGVVRAKTEGVVTERYIEPGSPVSANEQLFRIEDTSTLVIRAGMSELDVIHIDRGDSVRVYLDAYPDQPIEATVRRIFPSAESSSRRFLVEVALTNSPEIIVRPGFMGRATFDVDRREKTLAVPSEALLASQRGEQFLFKIENDSLVRVDVEIGVARRNRTEITSGLLEGDVVVGTNPTNLNEGAHVRITEWIE
ncbi:efflux RND transporter periplasmic adaptor subunit [Rhodohalobacter sp. SW132]|uniref:efflux RND transporter periplasmic adaptor subunit n=1 Tax=Rhodohalobacter sp. SW132 TaxID=2293433 RepID=UPI0013153935|nr:efflux RND transporter periplasmic adaptor subunit [Rhodohalobacter sp. SW132]